MPNTNGNLDGKVAFVTGAASGIDRATALASPGNAPTS
jgi:NADP-dependent 3-hydroxy acid dehydrogenase YdfG